ncbi:TPA: cysteine--tRNA ligase [Patescibacteria group bacterium]|nr:cysteine--tRNA ligase [Patescibacteria group bacterium]
MASLRLYNTWSRTKEEFKPQHPSKLWFQKPSVSLYTCGPTVYDYPHLGNLRTYLFEDILKRTLLANGYDVKHVMNITDVGHLTSDADEGEDKMEKGARAAGKSVTDLALFYTKIFKDNLKELNILKPDKWTPATKYIKEQIELIKRLVTKGYTYETNQAIYFNVKKFPNYTKLSGQPLDDKTVGARQEVVVDKQKKHPADFALWFKLTGKFKNHVLHWPAPWGDGFPGWHLECSAMAMNTLGDTVDIHCGGIDHISVHHANEIAQSEAVTGKTFVRYWLHGEFLTVDKGRMGKSEGNSLTLNTLKERGFAPLAYRYLILGTHYRTPLTFSWESAAAAQEGLNNFFDKFTALHKPLVPIPIKMGKDSPEMESLRNNFLTAINDDLNAPKALAVAWDVLKSNLDDTDKRNLLLECDKILGLRLDDLKPVSIPTKVTDLVKAREMARQSKNWIKSDEIRQEIEQLGFKVEDTDSGPVVKPKR